MTAPAHIPARSVASKVRIRKTPYGLHLYTATIKGEGTYPMIHIRIDNEVENSKRKFACGIGPELPEGDKYFFQGESAAYRHADCPGCNPAGPQKLGTPISELSGRPGHRGYDRFVEIARSWGYE